MTADRELSAGQRLAAFEIHAVIGEGGSAVVYDARAGDRRVALKVLRKELALSGREIQRFVDEAKRMVVIDHPGLVKLESAGLLPDGRPYLAMPFLNGQTLAQRLTEGPLPAEQAIPAFVRLARAVAALHAAGIVHRDIKPENILLVEGEERLDGPWPVLLDLGIARDIETTPSTTTLSGRIRGTPAYMAPERFFGAPASVRSDLYELAVAFYMMLVGKLPWGDAEKVSERLSPRTPDDFRGAVPPDLARAILKALSTRPETRPETAEAFAAEVESAWQRRHDAPLDLRTTEAMSRHSSEPTPMAPARPVRRRALVPLTGFVLALLIGGALFFNARSVRPTAPPTAAPVSSSYGAAANATERADDAPIDSSPAPSAASAEAPPPPAALRPSRGRAPASAEAKSAPTSTERAAPEVPAPRANSSADPFLEDRK